MLLCELCEQYAEFVVSKNQQPYFRHTSTSRDCVEKSKGGLHKYHCTNPLGFSLPLKVKFDDDGVEAFIGFLPLTEDELLKAEREKAQLRIMVNKKEIKVFNIDSSRFSTERISYLSIGENLAEKYEIDYDIKDYLCYWPKVVDGFSRNGTVFAMGSGKRLACNANVILGVECSLFCPQAHSLISVLKEVCQSKIINKNGYAISVVKATALTRDAADFFLKFGLRLTDNPHELTQIYPFAIRSPYVYMHDKEEIWFHKTDGYIDICPNPEKRIYDRENEFFGVKGEAHQVLSISRFEEHISVLGYALIRKVAALPFRETRAKVVVADSDSNGVKAGIYCELPKNRELKVVADYDGRIEVWKAGFMIGKIQVKGGEVAYFVVEWNRRYVILQGLDCVYEIAFSKAEKQETAKDEETLNKLMGFKGKEVKVSHSFGSIVKRLGSMPRTRLWLLKQLRNGKISEQALNCLRLM
jgi:hypothetical protein